GGSGEGGADRDGDAAAAAVDRGRRRRDQTPHPLGELPDLGLVRAGGDEHELLSAPAADEIGLADGAGDRTGDRAQHAVAGGVAELVVQRLEVVDVEEDEAERPAGLPA